MAKTINKKTAKKKADALNRLARYPQAEIDCQASVRAALKNLNQAIQWCHALNNRSLASRTNKKLARIREDLEKIDNTLGEAARKISPLMPG